MLNPRLACYREVGKAWGRGCEAWGGRMNPEDHRPGEDWQEEFEVAGGQLLDKVRELLQESGVRRLIIRRPDGRVLLEAPLSTGLAVGGAAALLAPVLATLGAAAALLGKFRIEVVRQEDQAGQAGDKEAGRED